jgi:hypothetical protein
MIPIVAGLLMGAVMGGGIAALQKKNILEGAAMGAAGGALGGVLMPAAGAAGAVGSEAAASTASSLGNVGATELTNAGIMNAGGNLTPTGAAQFMGSDAGFQLANPAAAGSGGIGDFITANKGALTGGSLGGMMASGPKPPSPEQGNIREFSYDRGEQNPLFGNPGESYYTGGGYTAGAVTPVEDYDKANGGIIALAEGGEPGIEMQRYARPTRQVDPAVAAYNAQIMERANQQYNINNRPAPNQVPGSVGYVAPPVKQQVAKQGEVGGITFNRETGLYEGDLNPLSGSRKKDSGMSSDGVYRDKYYDYLNSGGGADGEANGNAPSGDQSAEGMGIKDGGLMRGYNQGGISSLGSYSDGGQLLKGGGDGVSDSIPAIIGNKQPARLADGEFVVPARVVSELGNGSTDAGAKQLYAMMDRVQKNRKKTVGKGKVAVDAKSRKLLPA